MDKFVVSARKYRPQTFDTVVGQKHITTTLKNAIKTSQLAHAYLFCGPRGVGKTTCARIFAKTINCSNPSPEGEACDQCASCKSFNEGTSLNISELDAASNNSVEDIRTLVEQVRFTPQAGKYKVYIIDEVHMLSSAAFNAFLKTLEEPPSYVVFILATTEKHKLLPTILSRCQIFDFKRITNNDTVEHLESIATNEHVEAEKTALQIIAQKSEGCMRDALSIMDKIVSFTGGKLTYQNTIENLNILDDDYYFQLLEAFQKEDLPAALLLYNEINKKGFDGDVFLNGLEDFFRNLLVARDSKAIEILDVVAGFENKYKAAATETSASFIISALNILNEAEINYKTARNKRLHIEMALIKINYLQQAIGFASGGESAVVKKKLVNGPVVLRTKQITNFFTEKVVNTTTKDSNTQGARVYVDPAVIQDKQPTAPKDEPVSKPTIPAAKPLAPSIPSLKKAKGSNLLQSMISQQQEEDRLNTKVIEAIPLEINKLQQVWNAYADELVKLDKHTASNTFRLARLDILPNQTFTVTVQALLQQKFIDQERMLLNETIQDAFYNRNISFEIIIEEGVVEEIPLHQRLNSREKFALLAEKFPQLKNLKDKLRLEIE
ncbi:DNA polymerase III subunit gamma/tau [Rhizosphaericola mali]|uniref:DNA polymerase III subunit gamma/tau n=1 Tax=Rhizosphaericola mali TaxID=2545455 RepID=A0A5P2GCG6_9BACT|nr:DNA polymerase III subunit gamma/tau [Rhizosphaericola mali]QES89271.1 DNA polymerase III subunit gamma/tau [Rhizosphaericola mali]